MRLSSFWKLASERHKDFETKLNANYASRPLLPSNLEAGLKKHCFTTHVDEASRENSGLIGHTQLSEASTALERSVQMVTPFPLHPN